MEISQLPKKYLDFIEECRSKDYSDAEILHKHHVVPKFMKGDDSNENIVILNTQDHYTAHMILATQYEKTDRRFMGNIASANLIKRHFNGKTPQELSAAVSGKNNGMYGKTHSSEFIQMLKQKMSGSGNPFYGKSHSIKTRKKMSENHADFSGGKNPAAKMCMDKMTGKIYGSIKEMALDLGRRRCTIGKYVKDEKNERFCYV
jgi:hypothetical protein